jgi:hypothetical protein
MEADKVARIGKASSNKAALADEGGETSAPGQGSQPFASSKKMTEGPP